MPEHVAVDFDGWQVCTICHLLMPCYDGAVLAYPSKKTLDHYWTVNELREFVRSSR